MLACSQPHPGAKSPPAPAHPSGSHSSATSRGYFCVSWLYLRQMKKCFRVSPRFECDLRFDTSLRQEGKVQHIAIQLWEELWEINLGGWTLLLYFRGTKGSRWALERGRSFSVLKGVFLWGLGHILISGHASAVLLSGYSSGAHDWTLPAVPSTCSSVLEPRAWNTLRRGFKEGSQHPGPCSSFLWCGSDT